MSVLHGLSAIDYLAARVGEEDSGESSHWRHYHSSFRFSGDGFQGLHGFGGHDKPPRGWRVFAHRLLQRKYRAIGRNYPAFDALDRLAAGITARQGRAYDLDVLRQTLTLAFLKQHVPSATTSTSTVAVIGDGFASMTSLLLGSRSARQVVLVNLSKTLLVDLWYLRLWLGDEDLESNVALASDAAGLATVLASRGSARAPRVVAIEAANHELLRQCELDLAINIASMQEMDPPVIAAYFDDLRAAGSARSRPLVFYCCNRVAKTLPDGTVTRFEEYSWQGGDGITVDGLCPWHQQFYMFRPPFYRPFDGPVWHRLATLGSGPPTSPALAPVAARVQLGNYPHLRA